MAAVHVHAERDGVAPDPSTVERVSNLAVNGTVIDCDVTGGSLERLLRALVDVGAKHMTTREPSLEELLMSRYGDQQLVRGQGP